MEAFLKADPKIQVLFAHNDQMALGAIQAIKEAGLQPGKDIIIISIDAVKGIFQAIVNGEANATVECNPLLGPQAVQAIRDLRDGKKLPAPDLDDRKPVRCDECRCGPAESPVLTHRKSQRLNSMMQDHLSGVVLPSEGSLLSPSSGELTNRRFCLSCHQRRRGMTEAEPILSMKKITKVFPGVKAFPAWISAFSRERSTPSWARTAPESRRW